MIIIGVDPGMTTGLAVYDTDEEKMEGLQIAFDDFGDWFNVSLSNLVKAGRADVAVACERFTINTANRTKARDAHWALEIIGIARYLSRCYGVPFVLQNVASAKGYASDVKLRTAKWYIPGHDHANDAMRHVALMMAQLKMVPPWII